MGDKNEQRGIFQRRKIQKLGSNCGLAFLPRMGIPPTCIPSRVNTYVHSLWLNEYSSAPTKTAITPKQDKYRDRARDGLDDLNMRYTLV